MCHVLHGGLDQRDPALGDDPGVTARSNRPDPPPSPSTLLNWIIWVGTLVLVVVVGAVAWVIGFVLWPLYGEQRAPVQLDAIRTAGTLVIGIGGAVALLLTARRQRSTELTLVHTTHDATERRITELYIKAADQLGSVQAPVRLAGLYALERLAHSTVEHRQTIVDVICAYLRMPYTPPEDKPPAEDAPREAHTRYEEQRQQLQVRLTAQRILSRNLRVDAQRRRWWHRTPPNAPAWPGIGLDLTGALLLEFSLTNCQLDYANFTHTQFIGEANLETQFTGDASFMGARFTGGANFRDARFTGEVNFRRARFPGEANFVGAQFTHNVADFGRARFTGGAHFWGAQFTRGADFGRARFTGGAFFRDARFCGVSFQGTRFPNGANFWGAQFTHYVADFEHARFTDRADFRDTRFASGAIFRDTRFTNGANFLDAQFTYNAEFGRAQFIGKPYSQGIGLANFRGARFTGGTGFKGAFDFEGARVTSAAEPDAVWPPGWTTRPAKPDMREDPDFLYLTKVTDGNPPDT